MIGAGLRVWAGAAALVGTLAGTWAGSAVAEDASGALASRGLSARLAEVEAAVEAGGSPNRFELGTLQVLRAVERSLQTRAEYGLGDRLMNTPILRMRVPGGLAAPRKQPGPGTLSEIMTAFGTDIAAARTTLEGARAGEVAPFTLVLNDIWFDLNMNATRDKGEDAITLLAPVILDWRARREFEKTGVEQITVRFDAADLAWLVAYTHVLSGTVEAYKAFDPTPVLASLAAGKAGLREAPRIPNYYDLDEVQAEIDRLKAQEDELKAKYRELRKQMRPMQEELGDLNGQMRAARKAGDDAKQALLKTVIDMKNETLKPVQEEFRAVARAQGLVRQERRAAEMKLPLNAGRQANFAGQFGSTMDLIYVVVTALKQQPEAAHVQAAFSHWRAAIAENRTFWSLVEAETDNDREWIPNARQTSALGLELPNGIGEAWQGVLDDAEAVLNGRLLLPHPMMPPGYGISLTSYERSPTPLDLVGLIHGIAMYEHAAQGPMISNQRWAQFNRLTNGRAGMFALFFN